MPNLGDQGFLSPEIGSIVAQYRVRHAPLFVLAERANEVAHKLMFATSVKSAIGQQVLIACLLQRGLTSFQSVVILSERGLPSEARVVLRTLLEVLFRLVAIAKDAAIGVAYVREDEQHRKKFINKFRLLSDSTRAVAGDPVLDSLMATVKQRIENDDIRELKTQWFAERAGLQDFYHSAYSLFSGSVHVNVRDLESAVHVDADGDIVGFNYAPSDQWLVSSMATAIEAILLQLEAAFSILPLSDPCLLQSLRGDFESIQATIPTDGRL